jgi:hypothetical protein
MNNERIKVISELVELGKPLNEVADRVGEFPWDYTGEPVTLTSRHIASIVNRFLSGELSSSDIERWANLIEGRDDVDFEKEHQGWIGMVVHELANPILTEPLTVSRARELLDNRQTLKIVK